MRLEITRKTDLAVRGLVLLGTHAGRVKAAELAARLGTTAGFVPQILAPLTSHGWVRSDPGPTGGYRATVDLADVTLLDVIEAVEGPTESGRCVTEDRPCAADGPCPLHGAWSLARAALLAELSSTSIAMIAAAEPVR